MKTMCPPGYHYNDFVATHALGHMIYGILVITWRAHCFHDSIYIYIYTTPIKCYIARALNDFLW